MKRDKEGRERPSTYHVVKHDNGWSKYDKTYLTIEDLARLGKVRRIGNDMLENSE